MITAREESENGEKFFFKDIQGYDTEPVNPCIHRLMLYTYIRLFLSLNLFKRFANQIYFTHQTNIKKKFDFIMKIMCIIII